MVVKNPKKIWLAGTPLKKIQYRVKFHSLARINGHANPLRRWDGKLCYLDHQEEKGKRLIRLFSATDETRGFVRIKVISLKFERSLSADNTIVVSGENDICDSHDKINFTLTPEIVKGESVDLWWPGKEDGKAPPKDDGEERPALLKAKKPTLRSRVASKLRRKKVLSAGKPLKKVQYRVNFHSLDKIDGHPNPWKQHKMDGTLCYLQYLEEDGVRTVWLFRAEDECDCFLEMEVTRLRIESSLNIDDSIVINCHRQMFKSDYKMVFTLTPEVVDGTSVKLAS